LKKWSLSVGIEVDHSTVHSRALKLLPVLEEAFRRSKRPLET
jgi:putative transposase